MTSPRIRRWAVALSAYDYDITYKKGTDFPHKDALSRLPVTNVPHRDNSPQELVLMADLLDSCQLITFADNRKKSRCEPLLSLVLGLEKCGWPLHNPGSVNSAYFTRRYELSVTDDCLLWRSRVVISEGCRASVLDVFHHTHLGMARMKTTAHSYAWWPGIDKDIENAFRICLQYDAHQNTPPVADLHGLLRLGRRYTSTTLVPLWASFS